MTHSHPTNPTPDQPLTPTLFQQIQSLFLLQNSPIHTLYTHFQLSLAVLFSILHDHTTLTLRRAIDEHTYLCAQRAHLELILETENVAIALAKTENPTQEQRRRLGTLNATLKTSFKNLQALRDSLLNDDANHTTSTHTPKPTHTKRTTPRRTLTHTNTNTNTHPTPTATPTTPAHTNSNPTHTTETHTHTAPTPSTTRPATPTPHLQTPSDPRWLPILPLLTPEEQHFITVLEPDLVETMLSYPPDYIVTNLRNALALNPDALSSAVELTQTQ